MTPSEWLGVARSSVRVMLDFTRTDDILYVGEVTARRKVSALLRARREQLAPLLANKPQINSSQVDYEWSKGLPSTTLGGAYAGIYPITALTLTPSPPPRHFPRIQIAII